MARSLPRMWLGTGLFIIALTLGCQHARRSTAPTAPPAVTPPFAPRADAAITPPLAYNAVLPMSQPMPAEYTAAKPTTPIETAEESQEAETDSAKSEVEETQAVQPAINPYKDGSVPRRTFTDITAHPKFAHDANYQWLVGKLDYSKIQQAWTLRYASVEEDDRYGGSVTLVEPGRMSSFQSGQLVRVEGRMENGDDFHARPPFRVQSIRAVEP